MDKNLKQPDCFSYISASRKKQTFSIVGPSGSGKTILLVLMVDFGKSRSVLKSQPLQGLRKEAE
jgi:ABC-type lipoprotein export system ATPase subunit